MHSLPRHLLFLGGAALLLVGCCGSSLHSLHYFLTLVSDPAQEEPQFYLVGYVDDQPFISVDVVTGRVTPLVPWMEEFRKDDPQDWDQQSKRGQDLKNLFEMILDALEYSNSNSTGVRTLQVMSGCKERADGRPAEMFINLAKDGENLDEGRLTWLAVLATWGFSWGLKHLLEGHCVEWLQQHLSNGSETLQRTVPPTVKVARRKNQDGNETLLCRAYGFYPKEINITWTKDGMQQPDTLTGGVVPNSDWTYHKWLSINVDPKNRDRYQCHVEHDGLLEPLDLAWNETASLANVELIVGVLVRVLPAAVLVGEVIYYYIKKRNHAKSSCEAPAVTVIYKPEESNHREAELKL